MKLKISRFVICIMAMVLSGFLIFMSGCEKEDMNEEIFINNYNDPYQESLIFSATFDENKGNVLTDSISKKQETIQYVFNNATYKNSSNPKWNTRSAVSGSCLAFDGYSNYIQYPSDDILVFGKKLTVDLFIAPRMFEWDVPGAVENNTENLQVIIGQYDYETNAGFVIGMHKYGEYSFQVGLKDRFVKIWNEWNDLDRYTWNHLTFTFDGEVGHMAIYKNGEIVNYLEGVYGEIAPALKPLNIGKSHYPNKTGVFELNMFNGLMDEIRIYNQAISADDILKYHQSYFINGKVKPVIFEDAWLDKTILEDDIFKPKYHAAPPQHWMNEPHALFFYNGTYHLFFQFNLTGPYWRQICWGHWTSKDMVNWKNVKEAIIPMKNSVAPDGIWSGNAAYKADGTPVLFITAGDDAKSFGQWSNQNVAIAVPKDLTDPDLTEWILSDKLVAVATKEMGKTNEFRDPNVYYEVGVYYMVVSAAKYNGHGTALLFTTTDDSFLNWDYQGELFVPNSYYPYMGSTWELVNLVKVFNKNKTVSKYLFAFSPAGSNADNDVYYYLGDFNKETLKFIPEHDEPMLMDYGNNVFTGPTISTDPLTGRVLICSIIQGQRTGRQEYNAGWAHSAGIPRELSLDDQGNLMINPLKELDLLKEENLITLKDTSITIANNNLEKIDGNQLYIRLQIANENANKFGLIMKKDLLGNKTILGYNNETNYVSIDTTVSGNTVVKGIFGGSIDLKDDYILDLEIFIDGAMIEVYINGYKTITAMVYNHSSGMEIFADGKIMINKLEVVRMKKI